MINTLAQHKYFSKYDLKSAYYQVPLISSDEKYTDFEANGKLYHFKRIPYGICNAVGAFQRIITKIIDEDGLKGTYPYLDDVTIAGNTLEELDERAQQFENACKRRNMTLNEDKTVRNVNCLNILGYQIKHQHISPDPDRLKPLMDMPVPSTLKELKRVRGLFAYYSIWIMDFSTKIKLLAETRTFPLPQKSIEMFET